MKNVPRHELLLVSLTNYYTHNDPSKIERIESIIAGKSRVSLRLIDWYVTNYCKKHNVVLLDNERAEYFNVYTNYRSQLKAFKKVQFDPFRRRDRILFRYAPDKLHNTTVGQLNFFRWALDHGILDSIESTLSLVESDMLRGNKDHGAEPVVERAPPAEPSPEPPWHVVEHRTDFKSSIKHMTTFTGSTVVSFE